jgi:branched-subunit amino acid transport protein
VSATWTAILVASVGCYGLKLAGVSLPDSLLNHDRVQRIAGLLPVAMLTALVITDLFDTNGHYSTDLPALAGLGAAAVALRLRQSLAVVFLAAVAVTAVIRAAT